MFAREWSYPARPNRSPVFHFRHGPESPVCVCVNRELRLIRHLGSTRYLLSSMESYLIETEIHLVEKPMMEQCYLAFDACEKSALGQKGFQSWPR